MKLFITSLVILGTALIVSVYQSPVEPEALSNTATINCPFGNSYGLGRASDGSVTVTCYLDQKN